MTDQQLTALRAVALCSKGRVLTDSVLQNISEAIADLLNARAAFRETDGRHTDWCNSIMGWGPDSPCDCPYRELTELLGRQP